MFSCEERNPKNVKIKELDYYPNFIFLPITIPEHLEQSADSMAKHLVDILKRHNEIQKYADDLTLPFEEIEELNHSGRNTWNRRWCKENGVDAFLKIHSIEGSDEFYWEVRYNGFDSTSGKFYQDFTHISATLNDHGDRITIYVYDQDSTSPKVYYEVRILENDFHTHFFYFRSKDYYNSYNVSVNMSKTVENSGIINGCWLYYRDKDFCKYNFYWNFDGIGNWNVEDLSYNIIASGSW